jgi:hypothetical protein
MSIVRAELKVYRPVEVSDALTNGGRMTAVEIPSGVLGNLFPDAGEAERTAGSTRFRKAFYKNTNIEVPGGGVDSGLTLSNTLVFVENFTPGDDAIYIHLGTQVDTENDLTGSEDLYGSGDLDASVSGGATSIDVAVEDGAVIQFRNGDLIRISDKDDIDASGTTEFAQVNGVPSILGDVVTLPITALVNSFTAPGTRVSAVIEFGDLTAEFDTFVVTAAGTGTYDEVSFPPEMDNIASIEQNWTLTFSDATNYTASGDTVGSVGSGTVGGDFAPTNPDFGRPYFTLRAAGFGGTFQNGDTITFHTVPASVPVWHKRIIPAGAASLAGNQAITVLRGESA